jgi:hypothetical protein
MSEFSEHDGEGLRSPLARELIRAGRSERASASARANGLQALSVAGTAATSSAWLTVIKWAGLSAFVLGGVGAALRWSSSEPGGVSQLKPAGSQATEAPSAAAAVTFVTALAASAPAPRSSVLETATEVRPRAASARAPTGSAKPSAPTPEPRDERLRQELAALQLAQAALARRAAAEALAILDAKQGGFQLLPVEAGLVRVDALRRAGQPEAASELAAALLRQYGAGPYAHRLQALAGPE